MANFLITKLLDDGPCKSIKLGLHGTHWRWSIHGQLRGNSIKPVPKRTISVQTVADPHHRGTPGPRPPEDLGCNLVRGSGRKTWLCFGERLGRKIGREKRKPVETLDHNSPKLKDVVSYGEVNAIGWSFIAESISLVEPMDKEIG